MNTIRFPVAIVLTLPLAAQAMAYEHLIGEYAGKFRESAGYSVSINDPCVVVISKSDAFWGGSIMFEIQNAGSVLIELQHVRTALEENTETVRLVSPGGVGKPPEGVVFTFNSEGRLKSLKLIFKGGRFGQDRSILCAGLLRK